MNLLGTLLLSLGTPMLLAGDEFGNSQNGNNNAYTQDNDTTWLDWDWLYSTEQTPELKQFNLTSRLITLRKSRDLYNHERNRFAEEIRSRALVFAEWTDAK